jgi:hypothetical protein
LFIEDFDTWDMTGYYLYSKLLRSGVSRHIGTGGIQQRGKAPQISARSDRTSRYSMALTAPFNGQIDRIHKPN